jgi:hypothetical protein
MAVDLNSDEATLARKPIHALKPLIAPPRDGAPALERLPDALLAAASLSKRIPIRLARGTLQSRVYGSEDVKVGDSGVARP